MFVIRKYVLPVVILLVFNSSIKSQLTLNNDLNGLKLNTNETVIINSSRLTNCQITSSKEVVINSANLRIINSSIEVIEGSLKISSSTQTISLQGENQLICKNFQLLASNNNLKLDFLGASPKFSLIYQNTLSLLRMIELGGQIPQVLIMGKNK